MGPASTVLAREFLAGREDLPKRVNIHPPQSHMSMWRLLPSPMSIRRFLPNPTKELPDTLDQPILDITGAVSTILDREFLAGTEGLPRRVNIHLPLSHMSIRRSLPNPTKELLDTLDLPMVDS